MRSWLRDCRRKSNKTLRDISEGAGISIQAYSYIETGERNPTVETAKKIAAVLGFDWTKFFEDTK